MGSSRRGGGFVARGNIGGGGAVDEAGPIDSAIDTRSHPPIPFMTGGLCRHISSRLLAITCTSRLRRSQGNSWHWHNVVVVETSTVVVVVVVSEERHCSVMVMRWCLVWKL